MNRLILKVPAGIRYISDWASIEDGYRLENYNFPHIVDKKITGCGFTEYCLTNNLDVILCSPRRILLENKENQHTGDLYYFRNDLESVIAFDKDLSSRKQKLKKSSINNLNDVDAINRLKSTLIEAGRNLLGYISRQRSKNLPVKILVTYDSFRIVRDLLKELFKDFYVVVDEFQSIFTDSRFKSDTELEFLKQLMDVQRLCYVSATPMIDKYLERIDNFKDLPYFEFDWASEEPGRVIKPNLEVRNVKSILGTIEQVISQYRNGEFIKSAYIDSSGRIVEIESKEAVIYVNSVQNICDIIRKCELFPEECNILCAKTAENLKKLTKAFKDAGTADYIEFGKVPKKGEPHKMFTLCTRTVYLGADFYSTNARSFIVSDANIDSLAVDISLDLPQILGRQRLDENPWKNSAILFFRTLNRVNQLSREDFDLEINRKLEKTEKLLKAIDIIEDYGIKQAVADKYRESIEYTNYSNDYVAVNIHEGRRLVPVLNNLVLMAEERAFEIQQVDYKDRFAVFNIINESGDYLITNQDVIDAVDKFSQLRSFEDKMKFVCTIEFETNSQKQLFLNSIPIEFKNYFCVLGPEVCASQSYRNNRLFTVYTNLLNNQDIDPKERIIRLFKVGDRYSYSEIKQKLGELYLEINLIKTPKATDINQFFDTRPAKITINGKREGGYLILGIKSL